MIFKTKKTLITAVSLIVMAVSGCGFDNGLPDDLKVHLAIYGIQVQISDYHAPISSRAGFVSFAHHSNIQTQIISSFKLVQIESRDPRFHIYTDQISEPPISLWGIAGRPKILKLKNGGQFEHLYLLITKKRSYLFAEYAYG